MDLKITEDRALGYPLWPRCFPRPTQGEHECRCPGSSSAEGVFLTALLRNYLSGSFGNCCSREKHKYVFIPDCQIGKIEPKTVSSSAVV